MDYDIHSKRELVLVTGGSGLVGKAIQEIYKNYDYDFFFLSSRDLDLRKEKETIEFFKNKNPDYVIHLAGNVGGVFKNIKYKVEMFEDNMKININVLNACHQIKVKKLVSCLSTCIFPDKTEYPIDETMLHNGPPHWSNDSYAYSKRMLDILSKSYRDQYRDNFVCVIPCNVYGKYDNFSLDDGHVIPSLIHRAYLSKRDGTNFLVKGSGKPLRQFIYSEDLAKLLMSVLFDRDDERDNLILSSSKEYSIREVSEMIAVAFGIQDRIVFCEEYEDGQFRKTASNDRFYKKFPDFVFRDMEQCIFEISSWFTKNYEQVRK
jgi:GDP-L-fucose synthase